MATGVDLRLEGRRELRGKVVLVDFWTYTCINKSGHVAAWEEPEIFANELRAAFKTLR